MNPQALSALIVEDDPSWQQILTEILTDQDLSVDLAANHQAAEARIRSSNHRLIVLDLSLSNHDPHNQDGLQVLKTVRQHDPNAVIIFLTGYATVELAVSLLKDYGVFTCMRKETFRRAAFRELLEQVLVTPVQSEPVTEHGYAQDPSRASLFLPALNRLQPELPAGVCLVVDDDPSWRSLLVELTAEAGFQVDTSSSFVEALGQLKHTHYNLAIIDLALASSFEPRTNLDGLRLLSSTHQAGIPTIVVSGNADPQHIERAYDEFNLLACIEKQAFDRQEFIQKVTRFRDENAADPGIASLTPREREVLVWIAQGLTNKQIAVRINVTTNTVKRHQKSIFEKLDAHSRAAVAARAVSAGLVEP